MNILLMLIPLTLVVMAVAPAACLWSVKAGQFDDLEGPAHRILFDDDDPRIPASARRAEQLARHRSTDSS